jgi:hypothetical protein
MGTPLVTVAGGKMANRVGASLMTVAGRGLYVDASLKAYEDSVVLSWGAPPRRVGRDVPLFNETAWAQSLLAGIHERRGG